MESLTIKSNCSLETTVELKSDEPMAVEEGHLERFDSVESFQTRTSMESLQTRTSTESYETVRPFLFFSKITCQIL